MLPPSPLKGDFKTISSINKNLTNAQTQAPTPFGEGWGEAN